MSLLTRDEILEADDRRFDTVPVPEWKEGGEVRLASISGTQRDNYEQSLMSTRSGSQSMNLHNARVKLIVMCAVGEDGRKMFTSEDVAALGKKNAKPIDRLFDACRELVGMTDGDVERLTENLDETPDDADTSA